jgi:hypothetical protein
MPAQCTGTGSLRASGTTKPGPAGPSAREGHKEFNGKMGWHERTV